MLDEEAGAPLPQVGSPELRETAGENGAGLDPPLDGLGDPGLAVEIAHDLRSPLTSILFLAETLHGGHSGPVTPLQRRQLALIYSAAHGVVSMANDLLDLVRDPGLVRPEPVDFSVSSMLGSLRDVLAPIAEQKNLELITRGPADDRRIGQPLALSRVLLNLGSNALKFTTQGMVEILTREIDGDHLEFSVVDTGEGLEPDLLEAVRAGRSPHEAAGASRPSTGLGLVICRRLLRELSSELLLESTLGKGTRAAFVLHLPPVSGA